MSKTTMDDAVKFFIKDVTALIQEQSMQMCDQLTVTIPLTNGQRDTKQKLEYSIRRSNNSYFQANTKPTLPLKEFQEEYKDDIAELDLNGKIKTLFNAYFQTFHKPLQALGISKEDHLYRLTKLDKVSQNLVCSEMDTAIGNQVFKETLKISDAHRFNQSEIYRTSGATACTLCFLLKRSNIFPNGLKLVAAADAVAADPTTLAAAVPARIAEAAHTWENQITIDKRIKDAESNAAQRKTERQSVNNSNNNNNRGGYRGGRGGGNSNQQNQYRGKRGGQK